VFLETGSVSHQSGVQCMPWT